MLSVSSESILSVEPGVEPGLVLALKGRRLIAPGETRGLTFRVRREFFEVFGIMPQGFTLGYYPSARWADHTIPGFLIDVRSKRDRDSGLSNHETQARSASNGLDP
jgi:hypothetical protein